MTLKERIAEKIAERERKMHGYYKSVFLEDYEGGYPESYDDDLTDFITTLLAEQKERICGVLRQIGTVKGDEEMQKVITLIKETE